MIFLMGVLTNWTYYNIEWFRTVVYTNVLLKMRRISELKKVQSLESLLYSFSCLHLYYLLTSVVTLICVLHVPSILYRYRVIFHKWQNSFGESCEQKFNSLSHIQPELNYNFKEYRGLKYKNLIYKILNT